MMKRAQIVVFVLALLLPSMLALAGVSGPLSIKVTSAAGKTATWTWAWTPGQTSYTLGAPVQIKASDNTLLATINSLNCAMGGDPFLNLNYAVTATGTETFLIDSGTLAFASIASPVAFASAGTTITADPTDATFTGLFPGGKSYEATFNGGTVFADLDGTFSTPGNTSNIESDRLPPGTGFTPIAGPVSSMRTQWNFTLTDGDQASGTSRFEIEPVPDANTLVLALFAGVPALVGFGLRRKVA